MGRPDEELGRRASRRTRDVHAGASGDQPVNREKGGYKEYGEAIGAEVWKLAQGLQAKDVEKPALILKEERFPFKARVDLSNPMVHGMYAKAFFPS